jgi:hypothetical protein
MGTVHIHTIKDDFLEEDVSELSLSYVGRMTWQRWTYVVDIGERWGEMNEIKYSKRWGRKICLDFPLHFPCLG